MKTHSQQGFTIIETMLVLAISGFLVVALLVGVGTSINVQRYRDSVLSLQAFIQDQYSEIDNVRNDRDASWACGSAATPTQGSGSISPGQSDCVLLGRYISIIDDQTTVATVVGYGSAPAGATSDIEAIRDGYTLGISSSSIETDTLEWGAVISWAVTGVDNRSPRTPRSISIMIIRSPETGNNYTFTSDSTISMDAVSSAALKNMIVPQPTIPGRAQRTICVEPNGVFIPQTIAIYIKQNASTAASIETRTNATPGGVSTC